MLPELVKVRDFAMRYTVAWCSQNAANVAAHFSPEGLAHDQSWDSGGGSDCHHERRSVVHDRVSRPAGDHGEHSY